MKISKAHQRFADRLNNQRALEHPEEIRIKKLEENNGQLSLLKSE